MTRPKKPSVADVIDSLGHEMIDGKTDDMSLADRLTLITEERARSSGNTRQANELTAQIANLRARVERIEARVA